MPLMPTLHALHEYMFHLGYGQGTLTDNAITQDYPLNPSLPTPSPTSLSTPSPTAMLPLMHPPFPQGIDPCCLLPTPVSTPAFDPCCLLPTPASTPASLHSHSVASETSVVADSGMTQENLPVTSTARRRPRCNTEVDNNLYYPPKKLCITTDIHQSTLATGGEPPGPGFDPNLPHVPDNCNHGASWLKIWAARATAHAVAMKDVLHPGEEEEEWEADEKESGVDQMEAEEEGEVHDAGDSEQAISGPQTQL
ncbi:uncharacterized protein EDB93DRAFT_1254651 [Suillus bovinus]|uniref:uncharacterized protein n=1 Tax=Suillus bovinus TaxID=48563 RepID=UPI001B87FAFA|nr:uncharacterized protein EDB93DRAFT_1254651 [Suillus bovinus]KAG2134042.1 hypothetical protein EDB93DRAFT_1254651 [Suillus bovinus]